MAIHTAYLPPAGTSDEKALAARFVRDGVSLFALLLPALFLLWNRLWFALLIYLMVVAALSLLAGQLSNSALVPLLSSLPGLYLFAAGNDLVRARLERLGWVDAGSVLAANVTEAELRWFAGSSTNAAKKAPAWTSRNQDAPFAASEPSAPSIGIFSEQT